MNLEKTKSPRSGLNGSMRGMDDPSRVSTLPFWTDFIYAPVALFDARGDLLGANHAWRRAMDPSADGRRESLGYLEGPRQSELGELIQRVSAEGEPVCFRDVWMGDGYDASLLPLADERVLLICNPVVSDIDRRAGDSSAPQRVTMKSTHWGPLNALTTREREILALLASGLTIREAAERLDRSQKTVEGHRDAIYRKLGANSRAELALLALRAGLMTPDGAPAAHPGASS